MPNNYGPRIVTDGLVLCLDAGNTKSYTGSGTTWTDLSRNGNNGTLINGPTFSSANGGSIVFDGTNDAVQSAINCNKTNYSIDWWLYPATTQNFNQIIYFNSGWGSFIFHTTSTGGVYIGTTAVDGTGRIAPWESGTVTVNRWQNFTWTFSNGEARFYKNSVLIRSATLAVSADAFFSTVTIGTTDSNTVNGRIANFKMYSNKVLSPSEILQNYNATKGRFKL